MPPRVVTAEGDRRVIAVPTGAPYEVVVGDGVSEGLAAYVRAALPRVKKVALVADSNLDRMHAPRIAASLEAAGLAVGRIAFPAGERAKTFETCAQIVGAFARQRLTRADLAIALGGGVTGDLTGFAAAVYLRGIDFLQVPTSLLAMVDSSVGGKTGVDLAEGKNLAGAFHQPRRVFCDVAFLSTLPEAWRRDGMGEVLKYAMLGDAALFGRLEAAPLEPIGPDAIARCIEMKRDIVGRDEFETGERRLLNLGHTFAHAIETLSDYAVSHGSAVATGLAYAARVAVRRGLLDASAAARIARLVAAMGFAPDAPYSAEAMARVMAHDKKCRGDRVTLVLPSGLGECRLVDVPLAELADWIC